MRLLTYRKDGREQVGVLTVVGEEMFVCPIAAAGLPYDTMAELVRGLNDEERARLAALAASRSAAAFPLKEVELLAPIPRPAQDIICLGINYMDHAEESARYKKEAFGGERPYAIYFSKRANEAVGHGGFIESHQDLTECLDYEAELAVIIGREAKDVSEENASDYIFGYSVFNDVSARDVQTRHKQWYFGKSLDTFTVMGPWIVTEEEIPFPPQLSIYSRVNGELRQNSNTRLLIFDVAHVISELSRGMTLLPGTIIAMGTPAGVGMGFTPPKWLKPGDVVECGIEKIGVLRNRIR